MPPASCSFTAWSAALMETVPPKTIALVPTSAVVSAVTSWSIDAPAPASRPPAVVVRCSLYCAVWSAPRLKSPATWMLSLAPTAAQVVLSLVVFATAAAPAIAPPEPALVKAKLSSVLTALMLRLPPGLSEVPTVTESRRNASVCVLEETCDWAMPAATRPKALLFASASCFVVSTAEISMAPDTVRTELSAT